jgi:uncharacterized protein (DUF433 family)
MAEAEILNEYPALEVEDIRATIEYAALLSKRELHVS